MTLQKEQLDREGRIPNIQYYIDDEDTDEGDPKRKFRIHGPISETQDDVQAKVEKSHPEIHRLLQVEAILEELHNKVEDGEELNDKEMDNLLACAEGEYEKQAYEILKSHYDLIRDRNKIDCIDVLNLITLRRYAGNNQRSNWIEDIDGLTEPYFREIDVSDEVIESLRQEYFPDNIHYLTVRNSLENMDDAISGNPFWDSLEPGEVEIEKEREKRRYLYVVKPNISSSIAGYPSNEAPLMTDGSGGISGTIYKAVKDAVSKAPVATPKNLRETKSELEDKVEEEVDGLSEQMNEYIEDLSQEINENESLARNIRDDLVNTREGLKEDLSDVRQDLTRLDQGQENISQNQDEIKEEVRTVRGDIMEVLTDLANDE